MPQAIFPGNESMAHGSSDLDGATIDAEVKRFELSKIKLIKIDTEGAGYTVLKGTSEVLADIKIQISLHHRGIA